MSSRLALEPALRPVTPQDDELLQRVYASTREQELSVVPWTEAQRDAFLRHQFAAQTASWRTQCPEASWSVVEVDGRPAGRLVVDRSGEDLHIVDIALLPEYRGTGIGTVLLRQVIDEADGRGVSVTIYVEDTNRARTLYERLGFLCIESSGVYHLYRRRPAAQ